MTAVTNWITHYAYSTPEGHKVVGGQLYHSSNYAAGGDTITAATLGLNAVIGCTLADNKNACVASWVNSTGAMKLYLTGNATTVNVALQEMQAATNAINYCTAAAFIGRPNIG